MTEEARRIENRNRREEWIKTWMDAFKKKGLPGSLKHIQNESRIKSPDNALLKEWKLAFDLLWPGVRK